MTKKIRFINSTYTSAATKKAPGFYMPTECPQSSGDPTATTTFTTTHIAQAGK